MARIFIAIRFDDACKQALVALQHALRERGVQGEYCSYGNLHLTLAFIGENYDLPAIREAVNEVGFAPFVMELGALGSFPTRAGVIWCGIRDGKEVTALAQQLCDRLTAHGVAYHGPGFYPHISLVQHPSVILTDIEVPPTCICVGRIYIMKSERIGGELVYSEIE